MPGLLVLNVTVSIIAVFCIEDTTVATGHRRLKNVI